MLYFARISHIYNSFIGVHNEPFAMNRGYIFFKISLKLFDKPGLLVLGILNF